MSWILEALTGKTATAIASAASIVSLALTVAVYLGVRKIKRFYIFNARMPDLNERLAVIASKISSQLNSNTLNSDALTETLADAEVTLKSLSRKVGNPIKSEASRILKNIHSIDGRDGFIKKLLSNKGEHNHNAEREARIREIYVSLYRLNAECKEVYEDARWEQQ